MINTKNRIHIFLVAVACTIVARYLLILIAINIWPPQTINFVCLKWIGYGLGLATFFVVERHMTKRYIDAPEKRANTGDAPSVPSKDEGRFDA